MSKTCSTRPQGRKGSSAAPAPKAKPAPQAKPMAPQAAAVAAGGMRFQQAQAQQAPGKGAVPNSPSGSAGQPGPGAAAYASARRANAQRFMNRGMPQPGRPSQGCPSQGCHHLSSKRCNDGAAKMMAQQQFAAVIGCAMPVKRRTRLAGEVWQPPPSKEPT